MRRTWILGCALGIVLSVGCSGEQEETAEKTTSAEPGTPAADGNSAKSHTLPRRAPENLPEPLELTEEDWPQYRGQWRDGISRSTGLRRTWPADGPPVLWETAVGQGYASPSVVADRLYLNDYDEDANTWMVRCLNLDSGDELWRYTVKKNIRPNHAITRTAPATDGGFVIAIDPKCEVHCLDARDGSPIWKRFLPEAYETTIPPWYNGQCPLIDGDQVVLAIGGSKVLMAALEKATGDPVWETENTGEFNLSHSSLMPVEIDGVRQYAYNTLKGAIAVDADTGKLLWHFPWEFNTTVSSSPLPLPDGKFLLTAGYGAQTVVCQVRRDGDEWTTEQSFALPPPTKGWNSEVHTPILHNNRIYGIGSVRRGMWTCLDLEGNELWTSQQQRVSFGLGGYTLAAEMFFVLEGKTGVLRVLDAKADNYEELGSFQVLQGPDVWAPPVVAHGRLLIRDLGKLVCLDIAADDTPVAAAGSEPEPAQGQPESDRR